METRDANTPPKQVSTPTRQPRKPRRGWIILGAVLALLLVVYLLLPSLVKRYVNKTLAEMEGYYGWVDDIDIHLLRGAYVINGMTIQKEESNIRTPFFTSPRIDLSVEWQALWKGKIVGEGVVEHPTLIFAKGPGNEGVQTGQENDWIETVKALSPLRINRFEMRNGVVAYVDNYANPKIDIQLNELYGVATNLSNALALADSLPSTVTVRSRSTGNGKLNVEMRLNPLKEIPDMDVDLQFENAQLPAWNDFLKAYANVDAERGTFSFYTEAALIDGKLNGYFKPVITDLKVLDWEQDQEGFFNKIWQGLVGFGAELLENQPKDQFATRVPVSGTVTATEVGVWTAIFGVLGNAFVKPLQKRIDETIEVKGEHLVSGQEGKKGKNNKKKKKDQR